MTENALGIATLEWDSAFFGFGVGRVQAERLTRETAAECAAQARRTGLRCVYYLAPADDPISWSAAIRAGFDPVDIRVELELAMPRDGGSPAARPSVGAGPDRCGPATERDLPALQALADGAFSESRFFRDRRFPAEKPPELFSAWVRRGVTEPNGFALLSRSGERPVGFLSGRIASDGGRIELVSVAKALHGRGIGRRLLDASTAEFARRGATHVRVVTQGSNAAAQKLYQAAGFKTRSVGLWFHGWF